MHDYRVFSIYRGVRLTTRERIGQNSGQINDLVHVAFGANLVLTFLDVDMVSRFLSSFL